MTTIFWQHEGGLGQLCLEETGGTEREPSTPAFQPEPEPVPQTGQSEHWSFHDYAAPWFGPARRRY